MYKNKKNIKELYEIPNDPYVPYKFTINKSFVMLEGSKNEDLLIDLIYKLNKLLEFFISANNTNIDLKIL